MAFLNEDVDEDYPMESPGQISHGIENLFAVEQDIFRGGDPTPEGWAWLKDEGVRVVVKLNTQSEGTDAVAEKVGMIVHRLPIGWFRQTIWHPTQSLIRSAVALIQPHTFVHCEHGEDRTGLIVGCFRLSQGWTKEDAWDEMLGHRFHIGLQGLVRAWNRQRPEDWLG